MYYSNLEEKNVTGNKCFWKIVKPVLSDKLTDKGKINLSKNGEILRQMWR